MLIDKKIGENIRGIRSNISIKRSRRFIIRWDSWEEESWKAMLEERVKTMSSVGLVGKEVEKDSKIESWD